VARRGRLPFDGHARLAVQLHMEVSGWPAGQVLERLGLDDVGLRTANRTAERLDQNFVGRELAQVGEDACARTLVGDCERCVGMFGPNRLVLDVEALYKTSRLEDLPGDTNRTGAEN